MYFQFVGKIWGHRVSIEVGTPSWDEDFDDGFGDDDDDDGDTHTIAEVIELQDVDNGFVN